MGSSVVEPKEYKSNRAKTSTYSSTFYYHECCGWNISTLICLNFLTLSQGYTGEICLKIFCVATHKHAIQQSEKVIK
jgi:hypothetical protein